MKKLPQQVLVTWEENDGDEPYLIMNQEPDDFEDRQKVGVYKLVEVKTVKHNAAQLV